MSKHLTLTTREAITDDIVDCFIETLEAGGLCFMGSWILGDNVFDGGIDRIGEGSEDDDPTQYIEEAMEHFPFVGSYTIADYPEEEEETLTPAEQSLKDRMQSGGAGQVSPLPAEDYSDLIIEDINTDEKTSGQE